MEIDKTKNKANELSQKLKSVKIPTKNEDGEIENLQKEIAELKRENRKIKNVAALDKFGCLKSELIAREIPQECENVDEWIRDYKTNNEFLFRHPSENHGGTFKPSRSNNLSPTELMNNFIRGI